MHSDQSTETLFSFVKSLSYVLNFLFSPTSLAVSDTLPKFHSTCHSKSSDGLTDHCSFNTSLLNLHVAHLAGQKGGCIIVDSTCREKRFPDSLSKTIPIWTRVLNRAISNFRRNFNIDATSQNVQHNSEIAKGVCCDWDCSLHLPVWVSQIEKASIEAKLDEWTEQLKASCAY